MSTVGVQPASAATLRSTSSGQRMPMMLPGITISTTSEDYAPFKTLRIAVFDGTSWTLSGEPITAD